MAEKRKIQTSDRWTGSMGFIMASAGAAVGMGNLWRFPMLTGENGGGAFLLVYLICVVLIGIPMLLAEIAIGRHGKGNAFTSYCKVNSKWGAVGILAIVTSLVGLSYYTVLGGWIVRYLVLPFQGPLQNSSEFFGEFTTSTWQQVLFYLIYMGLTAVIVMKGVQRGIEKACKILMPILFVCLVLLAVRSCTLPGAEEGLSFFLRPDLSKITPKTWVTALGQVFFSLSVGAGAGITYGAYLDQKANIPKNAAIVAGFDTLAAVLAGLAILPAVFATGQSPEIGPGLMFVVLPEVFASMTGGRVFAVVFFVLVLFASITTTIAFLEVVVCFVEERFHFSKKKATFVCAGSATLLGIPCALSFGLWNHIKAFGKTLFDLADYCVSNLCLPISAILTCIFLGWVWKRDNAVSEITNQGEIHFALAKPWAVWVQFVLPIIIFLILLSSIGVF